MYNLSAYGLTIETARERIIEVLHRDSGVQSWQYYVKILRNNNVSFDDADLSECLLGRIDFDGFSLQAVNFEKATLSGAFLNKAQCSKAIFKMADLERARFNEMNATEADFSGAKLNGCVGERANFKGAIFTNSNLSGAMLKGANFEDADLSSAELSSAMMNEALFNEKTKFPPGFQPSRFMVWTGKGEDPRGDTAVTIAEGSSMDYEGFIKELWGRFDPERIQRSLGMLQSEKFQLFSDTTGDTVIGVARSQTKEDRVYACKLSSSGEYGCCTQNLRHCGALRGMACKHVFLVLMVLCKADIIDPAKAYKWLVTSLEHKPTLDKDQMTKTFLRYKGAEEGSIDWRPIETIPEDYYAL